jgi:hypothetical protein
MKEFLKPFFMEYNVFATDGSMINSKMETPGSKLRSRYDSARKDFIDQYGETGENWPNGQDGANAVQDFYKKIFALK